MRSKRTNSPWNSASSLVQISFIASTRSRITRKRVSNAVPWCSISSTFQPAPMPKRKRPPDRRSRLATTLARTMGSCSITRQMPVPSWSRDVTAAAVASPTKGSSVWEYSLGRGPPPGQGVRRLAGMWVCSVTKSDSKPRSSRPYASSSMRMEYSVGKMKAPICMRLPPRSGSVLTAVLRLSSA